MKQPQLVCVLMGDPSYIQFHSRRHSNFENDQMLPTLKCRQAT